MHGTSEIKGREGEKVKSDWALIQGVFVLLCAERGCVCEEGEKRESYWLISYIQDVAFVQKISPVYSKQQLITGRRHVSTMMSSGLNVPWRGEAGKELFLDILIDLGSGGCLASGLCCVIEDRQHRSS